MSNNKRIPGLIAEEPLLVFPSLAKRAGINKAIILQQVHFLLRIAEKEGDLKKFEQERWWVYNTYAAWQEKYFPWLAPSTIKRLFIELENEHVVLSIANPHEPTDQTKWYSIDYDQFEAWFNNPYQNETGQNETGIPPESEVPVSKCDGGASQIETGPVSKCAADLYTEITTETPLQRESESSSESDSPAPACASEPPADDDGDTPQLSPEQRFALEASTSFSLTDAMRARLLSRSPAVAVALMIQARRDARKGDGSGLLAALLEGEQNPDELALRAAPLAFEAQTIHWAVLDADLRRREYEQLQVDTRALAALSATSPDSADSEQGASAGLDTPVGETGSLTIADVWRAALGQLQLQLNRNTYMSWLHGATALRFADGTLTVQARHAAARDQLNGRLHDTVSQVLAKFAEQPITLKFV